tara:strand:+ start:147 stop:815 length:669 start_codon:yes stop_codon:yes gene_type:complete
MSPIIIFVEGNVGTGKTTFLKNLSNQKYKIQRLYEPVDEWIASGMLGKFYNDPDKYNLLFQIYCLFTRLKQYENIDKTADFVFIERSIYCDYNVFAKKCLKHDQKKYHEYISIYSQYIQLIREIYPYKKYFLYLRKNYDTCFNQIKNRGRIEENNIELDYIKGLHNNHEDWLNSDCIHTILHSHKYCKINKDKTVIICDGDYDVRDKKYVDSILYEIMEIIN